MAQNDLINFPRDLNLSLFQHIDHTPKSSAPSWSFFHFKQASFVLKQAPKAKKSPLVYDILHMKKTNLENFRFERQNQSV